jgi:DHA1 family bicyclomycin/chloramphenicol resistance-like MFS transporter
VKSPAEPAAHSPRLTIVLALLSTLGPFTIDTFFPSMRAMAAEFGISYWQVQQTLTAYLVPYALMSLVHGSLSDALGRRRVVIGGLLLYVLASAGCALAPGFASLLVCRALQGMVGGVGHIISRAVVRDCYSGSQAQKVMSAITMVFSLGPALAPVIGGWVHVWFGWRAVFAFMAIFGLLLCALVIRKLHETLPPSQRTPLHVGAIAGNTLSILRHPEFLRLTGSSGLCFIALHTYIGAAPAIIFDHWHLKETSFAALTLPVIGGYAFGAFCSGRLAGRLPPDRQANMGYALLTATSAAMLLLQCLVRDPPLLPQQLLLAATAVGLQLMFPIVTLRILDIFSNTRGTAASAHSFVSLLLAAVMMGALAPWFAVSMRRLALNAFLVNLAGVLVWRSALRYRRRTAMEGA